MDIGVTNHALKRWQERAAQYADAGWRELADAFREARTITDSEPLPPGMVRRPGFTIRRHEPTRTYIVAEAVSPGYCRLVTVLSLDGYVDQLVAIGVKRDEPGKVRKQKWSGVLPADVGVLVGYGPDHPPPPPRSPFSESSELITRRELNVERRRLGQEYHRLCQLMAVEPTDELRAQVKECQRRLREIRDSKRSIRR